MKKIGFTFDPLDLTRLSLKLYMEREYNGNEAHSASVRYSVFSYLDTLTDDELEELIHTYADTENVEEITLSEHDRERLSHYVLQSERYKDLVFEHQQRGHDGLGVADLLTKTFTPCALAHHWETLGNLLKKHHGAYGQAFDQITYNRVPEYAGVTEYDLNKFIMTNFRLVGSDRLKNRGIDVRETEE